MVLLHHAETNALQYAARVCVKIKQTKEDIFIDPLTSATDAGHSAVYINAGGPVWAIDWCEGVAGGGSFVALSAHPTEKSPTGERFVPNHQYSEKYRGSNAIQVWSIPSKVQPAKLVHTILHHGGFAWSLKWAPHASLFSRDIGIGVVAAALADGHFMIYRVDADTHTTLATFLDPHSTFLSISWSLTHPYMLLTGSVNGAVQMWNIQDTLDATAPYTLTPQRRFEDADACSKQPQHHWGAGWVAVRDIVWSPHDPYLFCTIGNDTVLRIWDLREPRACLRAHRLLNFTFGLQLLWFNPTTIFVATDQGAVFGVDPLTGMQRVLLAHPHLDSPVWSFASTITKEGIPALLSSCASGTLYQSRLDRLSTKRTWPTMWLKTKTTAPAVDFSFAQVMHKSSVTVGKRAFPDRAAAIYRVLFSPDGGSRVLWCSQSGLVGVVPYSYGMARPTDKPIGRPRIHELHSKKGRRKKARKYASEDDNDEDEEEDNNDDETEAESTEGDGQAEDTEDDDDDDDNDVAKPMRQATGPTRTTGRAKKAVVYEDPPDDVDAISVGGESDDDAPSPLKKRKPAPPKAEKPKKVELTPAKPRGRPRKHPLPSTDGPKKRGRPKKEPAQEDTQDAVITLDEDKDDEPPKKNGRKQTPLEKKPPTNEVIISDDDDDEDAVPPKKVTKPKKAPAKATKKAAPEKDKKSPADDIVTSDAKGDNEAEPPKKATKAKKAQAKRTKKTVSNEAKKPPTDEVVNSDAKGNDKNEEPKRPKKPTKAKQAPAKAKKNAVPENEKPPTDDIVTSDAKGDDKAEPPEKATKPKKAPAKTTKKAVPAKDEEGPAPPKAKAAPTPRGKTAKSVQEAETTTAETAATTPLLPGQVVQVAPRTWAGSNKLGGAGWIKSINGDGSFNIKYVLGGQERDVPSNFVVAVADDDDKGPSKRRRRG
ncbi:Aste57867_12353 [Aphanomyces stellatus]|uniref:Aste57867_12353 protein n=1 Tax=Aphanomyces stellatus TaxID=120398 RepID=A0A485KVT4_9STRA|nr:hypothetical protein As57867_012307 [Aphanomyces stellatus]VFT89205.1 Aste57867_12353 [Aphanomyces stellatus]